MYSTAELSGFNYQTSKRVQIMIIRYTSKFWANCPRQALLWLGLKSKNILYIYIRTLYMLRVPGQYIHVNVDPFCS